MSEEFITQQEKKERTRKTITTVAVAIVVLVLGAWGVIKLAQTNPKVLEVPSINVISENDHVLGNPAAPVKLVEYGDYECPACKAINPWVVQLAKDFSPDKLVIVFRNYPLPQHSKAKPAAYAAEAASKQGKFWEMDALLYDHQTDWVNSSTPDLEFLNYAEQLKLDTNKFKSDYKSGEVAAKVTADSKSGDAAGVNYTPNFFVNGKQYPNPTTYQQFYDFIKQTIGQ